MNTRIEALILIKRLGGEVSKRALAKRLGVNHNSIQRWRDAYEHGGIDALIKDGRIGFKPSIFNAEEHEILKKKVFESEIKTYVDLLKWVRENINRNVKYNTLLKYCIKHFGTLSQVTEKERKTPKRRKKHRNKNRTDKDFYTENYSDEDYIDIDDTDIISI
ncbi:MAG: helix-turn-helix domain-containing protein [Prevotellaceae bacterium]|nr:helix-turn-helix domain-containing protein [Prevotellaceae bacterium]